jgi:hemerythrin-like domain-containing protein
MARPIERIRAHHVRILEELKKIPRTVADIQVDSVGASGEALAEIICFLENDLEPLTEEEEHFLYPVIDDLAEHYERPTATMSIDHATIMEEIETFKRRAATLSALAQGKADAIEVRGALADLLETAHHLDAVLALHLAKEDSVLLALANEHLSEPEAREALRHFEATPV